MLATDPKQRPSIEEILRKKFIRQQQHLSKVRRLKESYRATRKTTGKLEEGAWVK